MISFFICGNVSRNLKKNRTLLVDRKIRLFLRYKINVERHKYRLISIAFISRYFNIACAMFLCLRKNFSIYRVIQVWNLHKNWCEEKPFILTQSWNRKTNWKQFHRKYLAKVSRPIKVDDKSTHTHTNSIVIRLSAIFIDSISFVKNIFHVRIKSILLRLHIEKI